MHRCFVPPHQIRGSTITIDDPRELHHLRDVLRLKPGDPLVCFDGRGREYVGSIVQRTAHALTVRIAQERRAPARGASLWLAQGLPKADRFDWVVQKATELGVDRVTPLITARTVVRPSGEQGRKKWTRWQRIAHEAATQCGRIELPAIDVPQPFDAWIASVPDAWRLLLPTLAVQATPLKELLAAPAAAPRVLLMIGPEGDFTRQEVAAARAKGAQPVSLGPLTLRSETAAIATLAILRYALDPA